MWCGWVGAGKGRRIMTTLQLGWSHGHAGVVVVVVVVLVVVVAAVAMLAAVESADFDSST